MTDVLRSAAGAEQFLEGTGRAIVPRRRVISRRAAEETLNTVNVTDRLRRDTAQSVRAV